MSLIYGRLFLQAGVGGGIAVVMGNDYGGAHQIILFHRADGAAGGSFHRVTLPGLNVDPIVGAPVGHGFIVQKLCHGKDGNRGTIQRGYYRGQQFRRCGNGGLRGVLRSGLRICFGDRVGLRSDDLHLLIGGSGSNGIVAAEDGDRPYDAGGDQAHGNCRGYNRPALTK